jgi:hypothetical protein
VAGLFAPLKHDDGVEAEVLRLGGVRRDAQIVTAQADSRFRRAQGKRITGLCNDLTMMMGISDSAIAGGYSGRHVGR